MKATEATLQATLNGPNQYVIPVFQRYYSWTKDDWERLWTDIAELLEPENRGRSHFMGSLVFVPGDHQPIQVPTYHVIDGQQRVVTLSVLLCAIRDIAISKGETKLAQEITDLYLIHPYRAGLERLRVYPRQRDRAAYIHAVEQQGVVAGGVTDALSYFKNRIEDELKEKPDCLALLFQLVITRLDFVHIILKDESPYRIFKSLNSTGVELSEGDLIRNLVFMHVPVQQQDEFDDQWWRPLEAAFEDSNKKLNTELLSRFFRDFLMSEGSYVSPYATFDAFENRYGDSLDPKKLTKRLHKFAGFYNILLGKKQHANSAVEAAIEKVRELETSTSFPLLLHLLDLLDSSQLSSEDFVDCVELTAGFIFRRYICHEQSRGYGRLFVSAYRAVEQDAVVELDTFFAKRGFPSDERFLESLIQFPLYSKPYDKAVLREIEKQFGHKEPPSTESVQIEHIMPQTLTDEWKKELGPEWERVFGQWLNTVGNLTLTAYNQELSNRPFQDKVNGFDNVKGYKQSNFELSKPLANEAHWNEATIRKRGEELAKMAVTIWRGSDQEDVAEEHETDDGIPYRQGSVIRDLYKLLSDSEWHTMAELEALVAGRANLQGRLWRLRRRGTRRNLWKIERNNGSVRMVQFAKAAGAD